MNLDTKKLKTNRIEVFQLIGLPSFIWLFLFVVIPALMVLIVSFMQKGTYGGIVWQLTLDNYIEVFQPQILSIFLKSLSLSFTTTTICLIIGILVAWSMATAHESMRKIFVIAIALPFLTNLIIRIYAIRVFVGIEGPLQWFLNYFGFQFDPFSITQNQFLVYYGMVSTYLPFMVLPLYGAFEKFDFSMVEAAMDLGAKQWKILFSVILPQLKNAILFGSTLVFVPSFGEYLIPDLLGGAKSMYIGNLITMEFLKSRNWPMGAAVAVLMMFILMCLLSLFNYLIQDKKWKN